MKARTVLLALALVFCASTAFAMQPDKQCLEHYRSVVGQERTFSTGEWEILVPHSFSCADLEFVYTGISSKNTFSFKAPFYRSAVNIFYPTTTSYFKYFFDNYAFTLHIEVITPHYITVRIMGVE